jgi:multicomponent Na+:H+ antiporter subunit E
MTTGANAVTSTLTWPLRIIAFAAWYLTDWFRYSVRVSRVVLSRRIITSPGIVRVPVASRTDAEVTLLASLITITPATLTLSIDRSGHVLHVHGMFVEDREEFIDSIQDLERRFLQAHRRVPLQGSSGDPTDGRDSSANGDPSRSRPTGADGEDR